MDAEQARDAVVFQVLGDGLVGHQHELLDQPMGHVPFERDDRLDHPFVIQDNLGLLQIEVDRAAAAAALVEDDEQLVHPLEERHELDVLRRDLGILVGQDRVDVGVGHPRVAVDHPVVQLVANDRALLVDLHPARLHQPIDVRIEAAQAGRELRREHVDRALREIHRGRAVVAFFVQGAALGHVVRDVGDVDAQPVVAVLQPLERDRVVEVAGVLAVDGDRHVRPEIGPAFQVPLLDRSAQSTRFLDRVLTVPGDDAVLAQDDLGIDARFVDGPEHLHYSPDRAPGSGRPRGDFNRHHVARFSVLALAGGNLNVHDQPAVERNDEPHAGRVPVEAADRILRAPLKNPDDPAFGPSIGNPLDPRDDAIAVHGLIQVAAGDEDVAGHLLERPIRHDEAKSSRIGGDSPDDEVHPIRQPITVAPGLNQLAVGDELAQQAFEGRALLAGEFEPLQQLAGRGGVVDLFPNQLQQLFLVEHM